MQKKSAPKGKVTIDNLAIMVARGFERMESTMATKEDLKIALDSLEERLSSKISASHNRIDDLSESRAKADDLYKLSLRVSKVEKKLGLAIN